LRRRGLHRLVVVVVPVAEPADALVAVAAAVAGFLGEVVPPDRLEGGLRGAGGAEDALRVRELRGRSAPPGSELTGERKEDQRRALCARRVHRGKLTQRSVSRHRRLSVVRLGPRCDGWCSRGTFGWAAALLIMQVVPSWLVQAK